MSPAIAEQQLIAIELKRKIEKNSSFFSRWTRTEIYLERNEILCV